MLMLLIAMGAVGVGLAWLLLRSEYDRPESTIETFEDWLEASTEEIVEITREFLESTAEEWIDATGEFPVMADSTKL